MLSRELTVDHVRQTAAVEWRDTLWLAVLGVSLAGVVVLLLMTRWGVGTSPDSVRYIKAARQLIAAPAASTADAGAEERSLVQHAPFYALVLAGVGLAGPDPLDAARWVNALLFGLNILTVGFLLHRTTRHAPWLALVGSILVAGSMPFLIIHVTALSEPLFLVLSLLGLYLLSRYLQGRGTPVLIASALSIGFAFLSRYAGAACILAAGLALLLFEPAGLYRRARSILVFGVVSALPMLAWMARNLGVAGTATGRDLFFHPVGRSHAWQALYTASSWLLIPETWPDWIRLAAWLVLIVALSAALFVRLRGRVGSVAGVRAVATESTPAAVITVLAVFVFVYGAFLVASISFFDANTPLDNRILSPVFVAGVIICLSLIDGAWPLFGGRPRVAGGIAILLVAFAGGQLVQGSRLVAASYADGWGFSSRAWQRSATLADVKRLPESALIYSNAPEIIYLHTRRASRTIPRTRFPMNQQPNPEFASQLSAVGQELSARCGMVVYFRNLAEQKSMPSEQEIRTKLALRVHAEERDGTILGPPSCPQ